MEEETDFIWMKESEKVDVDDSKYSLLPNKSLLIQNITLEVRPVLPQYLTGSCCICQDNGYYTCNVVTPLQSVRSTIQLIVSGETPEIINHFQKITVHEGETLGQLQSKFIFFVPQSNLCCGSDVVTLYKDNFHVPVVGLCIGFIKKRHNFRTQSTVII